MLTAKKFAERAGVTYPTIINWLKKGLVPGAQLVEDSPHGSYWQIPATSLDKVEKQKTGPKPTKKAAKKGGEMSRVRIHDLAKELKPETKKNLKIARRMGVAGALNVAGPRRRKPPKKGTKKAPDSGKE